MKIELLYLAGCPNRAPALEVVREAAQVLGLDVDIELVEVRSATEADRLQFLGSPTIRVGGNDIEPKVGARTSYGLSCRTYGRSGVPPRELVMDALRSAAGTSR